MSHPKTGTPPTEPLHPQNGDPPPKKLVLGYWGLTLKWGGFTPKLAPQKWGTPPEPRFLGRHQALWERYMAVITACLLRMYHD